MQAQGEIANKQDVLTESGSELTHTLIHQQKATLYKIHS